MVRLTRKAGRGMTIDWMNPSDDILEARRIGYEEGINANDSDRMTFQEYMNELRELIVLARGEKPDDDSISFESLKEDIEQLRRDYEDEIKSYRLQANEVEKQKRKAEQQNHDDYYTIANLEAELSAARGEIERLKTSRAAIADEQVILRKELDEAQRHWDKSNRQVEPLKAENLQLKLEIAAGRTKDDKLEKENERLKSERLDFENREGAICPEDVGFEEYIKTLKKQVEELELEVATIKCSNSRLGYV